LTSGNRSIYDFSVHDLYCEFATREANKCTHSRNCILHGGRDNGHYRQKRLAIYRSKIISLTKQELCECSTDVEILRVGQCDQLTKVDLRGMKKLLSIELLGCNYLEQVWLDDLQDLVWLHIYSSKDFMIPSIKGLKSLQVLKLWGGSNCSQSIVCESFHDCTSLIELEIQGYPELLEFPDLSNSRKLRSFRGEYCLKTKSLPGLSNWKELRHLVLEHVGLTDIQGLDLLNKLETLIIFDCYNLKAIPNLSNMGLTLRELFIDDCYDLEFVPSLSNLFSLKLLHISDCKQIEEIHGIEELQNLEELACAGTSIRCLPDLSMLSNLVHIDVCRTPIQEIGGLPENLEDFFMYNCAHTEELSNSVAYKTWTSLGANKFKKCRH
jgi:Leucine-rich repeat (LRR) protein